MNGHPIENLMKSTMENIKDMVDVNTIIGDPVTSYDGTVIIPVSKVSFGFGSGGSEFESKNSKDSLTHPFGGGSGAGISIKPVSFLIVKGDSVRLLSVEHTDNYDKLIESVPQFFDMIKDFFNKDEKESKASSRSNESECCCVDKIEPEYKSTEEDFDI